MNNYKREIESILLDNCAKSPELNKLAGDLSSKSLYRYKTSARLFEKRHGMKSRKVYNLVMLVDCSGSMVTGGRDEPCAKSVRLFVEEFQRLIPIRVVGFNVCRYLYKDLHEILDKAGLDGLERKIIKECHNNDRAYGNHDDMAVKEAIQVLKHVHGDGIILTLSDGIPSCDYPICSPECGHPKDLAARLKEAVRVAISCGIRTLGVGIQTTAVKKFYPVFEVLDEPEMIHETVLKLLKTVFRRRQM